MVVDKAVEEPSYDKYKQGQRYAGGKSLGKLKSQIRQLGIFDHSSVKADVIRNGSYGYISSCRERGQRYDEHWPTCYILSIQQ